MSDALTALSLAEARSGLAEGAFSARELADAHIKAAEGARDLNTLITETFERALADAGRSDERRAKGEAGALEGIPLVSDRRLQPGARE